eukprot:scaffold7551_cov168-Amphora_coffeaeformis.AAC.5
MFFRKHTTIVLLLPAAASAFTTTAPCRSIFRCGSVGAGTTRLLAVSSSSSTEETEAERLLRKARELRAAATQEEAQVHGNLTQKKAGRDQQSDAMIDELFPKGASPDETTLVNRLRSKKPGMATLERIILRIDERQAMAQGWDHYVVCFTCAAAPERTKDATSFLCVLKWSQPLKSMQGKFAPLLAVGGDDGHKADDSFLRSPRHAPP